MNDVEDKELNVPTVEVQSANKYWDKKKFTAYIIWTFSIAWILQVIASIFARQGNQMVFSMILAVSMFAPLAGAALAKAPLRNIGWLPKFKENTKNTILGTLAAWFCPAIFTILGAVLYFVIFPDRFDTTGMYLKAAAGEEAVIQLEAMGITPLIYTVIGAVQAITYAPWVNMVFALGEEAGWRGIMQPMLKERFGKSKGRIVGGIIWGAWHWPVMILAGYEYGLVYWGAPFLGMAMFCLCTVVLGTLLDAVYEKTQCIWVPALAHGAFNAIAGVTQMVLNTDYLDQLTLGPAPIGIISMLPMLIVAGIILLKKER